MEPASQTSGPSGAAPLQLTSPSLVAWGCARAMLQKVRTQVEALVQRTLAVLVPLQAGAAHTLPGQALD